MLQNYFGTTYYYDDINEFKIIYKIHMSRRCLLPNSSKMTVPIFMKFMYISGRSENQPTSR